MSRSQVVILFSTLLILLNAFTYYGFCYYYTSNPKLETLYLLQSGIFTNEANLNKKIEELKKHDIAAYVVSNDHNYIIYSAVASKEDQLASVKEKLESLNLSYVVKKVEFNDSKLEDLMVKKDYQTIIEQIMVNKGGLD